jgi:peptide-methionine (S)-S-oxide reductase
LIEREDSMEKATFAAGCFWGVEAAFRQLPGVTATRVGYTGGSVPSPTYEQVCTDRTGHAEAVEVTYDPERISYEELLEVFFAKHNPTTRNRQGFDIGSQYRSAVFFHSPDQERAARASIERLEAEGRFGNPIVTQVEPGAEFYEAEDYHQQYLEKRGRASCTVELAGQAS